MESATGKETADVHIRFGTITNVYIQEGNLIADHQTQPFPIWPIQRPINKPFKNI